MYDVEEKEDDILLFSSLISASNVRKMLRTLREHCEHWAARPMTAGSDCSNVRNVRSSQADFHTAVENCVFTCEHCEHWNRVYDVEEKEDDILLFSSLISASNVHKTV